MGGLDVMDPVRREVPMAGLLLALVVMLGACGGQPGGRLATCDDVADQTARAIVASIEMEVALVLEAAGVDEPDVPLERSSSDDPDFDDDFDVGSLPTEAVRPPRAVPDDADALDLIVHVGPAEEAAALDARSAELRTAADELGCAASESMEAHVAAALQGLHEQKLEDADPGVLPTVREYFVGYAVAGAHHRLVGRPLIDPRSRSVEPDQIRIIRP
jgi:hypothetical protein